MTATIFTCLEAAAERTPAAPALVDGRRRVDHQGLATDAQAVGRSLMALGLVRRTRVAIYLDKSIEMATAILACVSAGLIAVPLNPKLKPWQVAYAVGDCGAGCLITSAFRWSQLKPALPDWSGRLVLTGEASQDAIAWNTLRTAGMPVSGVQPIDADPAAILYTSGSTGPPKGVVLSNRNLTAGAESVNRYLGTRPQDVILGLLPLSFDAGLSQLTTAICAGACVVLHEYIRPQEVASVCASHGVTSITAVPPLWTQLAQGVWAPDVAAQVRIIANTGGHMPAPLLQTLRRTFPRAAPFLMYGLTEAFRSTYLDPAEVDRRPGSIGKAIPNAEVLVLDEHGQECPPGVPGELVHRGAHVALGYWNDAERTAERFRPFEGFTNSGVRQEFAVWSGDIVKRDEEGFLYFVGRRDEMIKSMGYRISPGEVESVLFQAACVHEAAVFGIPDEEAGQKVVAAVVPGRAPFDLALLEDHCRRLLPSYMTPHLAPCDALPRSPNGKIDRAALRKAFLAGELQLERV